MQGNKPLYTFLTLLVMLCAAVLVLIFAPFDAAHNTDLVLFFGLMSSGIPALVSSFFAERSSRDIRNGVVKDKAQEGAAQALEESGLTSHVHVQTEAQQAATAALITLLQNRTDAENNRGARKSSGNPDETAP